VKKLTASVLGLIAIFSPVEALAQSRPRSNHDDHVYLVRTALRTGINLKINPPMCDREQALGWYWAARNELAICQQNKMIGSSTEVNWTEEDYDTLRHEVHHLVQDCMTRDNRDGLLGAVYRNPVALGKEVLGQSTLSRIAYVYRDQDQHTILMEYEAFSVAAMNDPLEQAEDIQTYCL